MLNPRIRSAPLAFLPAVVLAALASCNAEDASNGDVGDVGTEASAARKACHGAKDPCDAGTSTDASSPGTDAGTTTDTDAGSTASDASTGGDVGDGGTSTPDASTDSGSSPPPPATSAKNCGPTAAATTRTYYVSPTGNDAADGSSATPWATITHAVDTAADGSTVLVRAGTYNGQARLDRRFTTGLVVRSEVPYAAKLRNSTIVVRSYSGQNITMEGFDVAHSGAGASPLVVQIQSVDQTNKTNHIILRNNVIHDSYNNDLIKLNNGAQYVTIEGNVFYNQSGSDEHIDVNSVQDCTVQDNIFFNDFGGSGRTNNNDTSAFVVVKDSNADTDGVLGAERISIRRNILLNWQGSLAYGFFQLGEDGTANFEAMNVMLENNLLIGNSSNAMRSPFATMGVKDITFRHNTVVGNFANASAFATRMYTYGSNQPNQNIAFYNNIWSDPTGTMNRFSTSPSGQTASFTLRNNLYWNGGAAIPTSSTDIVNVGNDARAKLGDPAVGAQTNVVVPRLNGTTFADGSTSICQAFERLVTSYGTPSSTSPALGTADTTQSPVDDILQRPRSGATDIGAVER